MEDKLLKVKHVFDKVKDMRSELNLLFNHLDGRICKLSEIYDEFIKNTNMIRTADIKVLIFSLDSFYFQNSLLRREYKYLKDYYNIIVNRMYGEYYKLFKLITEYIHRNLNDNKLNDVLKNKSYPRYDDLDDEKVYDFNLITQINEDIMNTINYLINILRDKETSLREYTTNQEYGLNVNNFVSTYKYDVIVLQEQITLYEKYLDFFYHVHEKLLQRLITKVSVLEAQLNADIKFEGGLIGKKKDNKVLFDELGINGLNKKTARELRKSITGDYSPTMTGYDDENNELCEFDDNSIITNTTVGHCNNRLDDVFDCIPPPPSPIEKVHHNHYNTRNSTNSAVVKLFHGIENTIACPEELISESIAENDSYVDSDPLGQPDKPYEIMMVDQEYDTDSSVEDIVEEVVEDIVDKIVDDLDETLERITGNTSEQLTAKQKKNRKKNIKKKAKKLHDKIDNSQNE